MPAVRRDVFNQKGGVGKSTITVNLAAVAAQHGQRVLVLDLDPQGNTSHYLLGRSPAADESTVADLFDQQLTISLYAKTASEFVLETPFPGLHLLASHPRLAELMSKLESRYKIYKLREALDAIADDYDEIWIDTPPALNFYTLSALIAAHRCLIPFDCDTFSRQALYKLLDSAKEIQADHNAALQIEGIVVNQFQARASLPREMVEALRADNLPVLATPLSSSIRIRESHEQARPMIHLDPRHKLSTEYTALYRNLQPARE